MTTILLVEDESSLVSYLLPELQFDAYEVLVASDGQSAWQLFEAHHEIDLVLLDWMLPKLDGLEVLRRIRTVNPSVPVIMMTARDYVGDKVVGLDNGANDYITKPFEIEELLARIRANLRKQASQASYYRAGDIEVDMKARVVRRQSQVTPLTQREFDLLVMFIQHVGQPLTRDQLLDGVWGTNFDGQVTIVDVYVRYLRQKLTATGASDPIVTVRGVGYMLTETG